MSGEKMWTEHHPSNEWIPTNGKKPELPDGTLLDVKFTNGTVDIRSRADLWIWTQNGYSHDITHYRIHQPASTVHGEPVTSSPVAAQHRFRNPQKPSQDWSIWQPATIRLDRPSWEIDSQGYEVEYRLLYDVPQPSPDVSVLVETLETALFGTPLDDVPNRDNDDIWCLCYPHLPERASDALRDHLARIETALTAHRKGGEV